MIELAPQLTPAEVGQLLHYEAIVERSIQGFRMVGEALAEIRDRQLYRASHPTFEAYLEGRWGLSRRRGYQLIEEAAVVADVQRVAQDIVLSGRAAREIGAAAEGAEERAELALAAAELTGGPVTAPAVAAVVAQREELRGRDDDAVIAFLEDHRKRKGGSSPPAAAAAPPDEEKKERKTDDEWYTRPEHIAAVVEVLGGIDLDPASCAKANETVGAAEYYTKEQDGLSREWVGRVFINPPYSRPAPFIERLLAAHEAGLVPEAIVLVNAQTGAAWFEDLWDEGVACFVRGRIKFVPGDPDRDVFPARIDSVFFYLGPKPAEFARAFERFGRVVQAVDAEDWA